MRFEFIIIAVLAACDERHEPESNADPVWATGTHAVPGPVGTTAGESSGGPPEETPWTPKTAVPSEQMEGDGDGDIDTPYFDLGTGGSEGDGDGTESESSSSDGGATTCTDANMSLMMGCTLIAQYEHYRYCPECTDPCTAVECMEECREDYEVALEACWGKYPLCGDLAVSSVNSCEVECGETMTACVYDVDCQGGTDTLPCLDVYTECMEDC
jgi:hypothetical protein